MRHSISARFSLALASTALLLSMLLANHGHAQAFTAPLVLELDSAAPLPAPAWSTPSAQAGLRDHEARKRQRTARLILAAGLGLLIGASVHVAAMAPRRQCSSDPEAPSLNSSLYAAGALGGIGFGLAVGGGTWLGLQARDRWQKPRAGERWAAAGAGGIGAGLSTLLPVFIWGLSTPACSS